MFLLKLVLLNKVLPQSDGSDLKIFRIIYYYMIDITFIANITRQTLSTDKKGRGYKITYNQNIKKIKKIKIS